LESCEGEKLYNAVLVKYSGEIPLKSSPVRSKWEKKLIDNIIARLKAKGLRFEKIRKEGGRLFIYTDKPREVSLEVSKVFGVIEADPVIEIDNRIETIRKTVLELARKVICPGDTFAVRARRIKDYPITSKEIEKILGADILRELSDRGIRVKLDNPDKTIFIEVRETTAYVYAETIKGVGGLPYGVSGKLVALFSGGMDSVLATWLMMRRGAEIVPVHFDLTPHYGSDAKERAMKALKWLREWVLGFPFKAYIVNIGKIHSETRLFDERYRCIFCKYLMYRIGERIAIEEEAHGIVTGESLSQVASQTPVNLKFLSKAVSLPIYRPVIWMDKTEIAHMLQKTNGYSVTAKRVLACKLAPKHPITAVKDNVAENIESMVTEELVEEALRDSEIILLD